MAAGGGTKAIVAAFFANTGIAISKFVGFLITGSGSMLAESVHSVADAGNQGLLLLGHRRGRLQETVERQFGYGRERFFWAFVVAVVLFTVGAVFSLLDGVEKLLHPHEIESVAVAIGILAAAIVMEIFSFRTAIHEARPLKGDGSWWRFIRLSKNPELPVVLLEDLAALVGLVLALAAVALSDLTGDPVWDAIGTLAIGVLLAVVAIILAIEMRSLLIGEPATPEAQAIIERTIAAHPAVVRLINLRTEHIGPDDVLVAAKVHFDRELTMQGLAGVVDAIEGAVRAQVPQATRMYLEPDVTHRPVPAADAVVNPD
ncbi:MAG: cation diffusion facilitator family transporter [Acidimicrobiia bacterium]